MCCWSYNWFNAGHWYLYSINCAQNNKVCSGRVTRAVYNNRLNGEPKLVCQNFSNPFGRISKGIPSLMPAQSVRCAVSLLNGQVICCRVQLLITGCVSGAACLYMCGLWTPLPVCVTSDILTLLRGHDWVLRGYE